jgi:hypothetical protein
MPKIVENVWYHSHMRWVRGCLIALGLACASTSCRGKSDAPQVEGAAEAAVTDEAALTDEEKDLLARRDALLNARRELHSKRAELQERRAQLAASGEDVSEVEARFTELSADERELAQKEAELDATFDELIGKRFRSALEGAGSSTAAMAAREAALAAREKALARREERLAIREREFSDRESALAGKWKESCATAPPTTIVQTVDVKGSKYTKKDVEPLLRNARREMSKKGILQSDLPAQAKDLEKEATQAMAEGDYGRARFTAAQLAGTVRAIRIDKGFVSEKWARLNRAMKGKRLTPDQEQLLSTAAASIADGKFANANRQLNKLFASAE